ncbi:uncharacterized protein N7482_006936 [Penicillium canariense]|uniref:BTB domain-containing protein n=1 Tax=Penicillium canariense TaxID=189055 RepID=A0A9W9LIM5_9EURO|nr:uncharacterized protein N7482_006936 [Penicillium canariense]KAJ5159932.1 hypothetical protein N7482_006936 [Penicillium canariense]
MEEEISIQSQGALAALSRCQKSGEFTDLALVCEGERINVHKVVVCSQSDVLHAACIGNFKEASSAVYEFLDDKKLIVGKLLSFFYTENYSDTIRTYETEPPSSCSALQLHARVFVLADKYIVKSLLALCVEKYQRRLQFLSDPIEFIESISEVYALPPTSTRTLKEVVAHFARINISNYLHEETVQMAYNSVAQSVPKFVKDLLDLYIEAPLLGNCGNCGQHVPILALQGRCRQCRRGTTAIDGRV